MAAAEDMGSEGLRMENRSEQIEEVAKSPPVRRVRGDVDLKPLLDFGKENGGLFKKDEWLDAGFDGSAQGIENLAELDDGYGFEVVMSVAEVVANARAPVKREFLTPAGVRLLAPNGVTAAGSINGVWDEKNLSRAVETKSKRQQKRERRQAKKSTDNICANVARTGDAANCPYGANCRFNHDLEGYKAQKSPDLPGKCPFLECAEPCSYGIACRFAGSHKETDEDVQFQQQRSSTASNEQNYLSKELQKQLWKNMALYPKADTQLQAMGLMNKAFRLRKVEGEEYHINKTGKVEEGETLKGDEWTGAETYRTTTKPGLETTNNAPGDSEPFKNQVVESAADLNNNTCLGLNTLICTAEPLKPSYPILPHSIMDSFPPQKKPRTRTDYATMDNFSTIFKIDNQPYDSDAGNVLGTFSEMDIDRQRMMDVCALDTLPGVWELKEHSNVGKPQNDDVKARYCKDDWQSLYVESKLSAREKKIIDFREKLYLAPLTTVGNLPFRRVCKALGADITCGEMAMCTNLLQGQASEWALLRRHSSEDLFGVQICGSFPDHVARTAELIEQECKVDFIDINMGCPIDIVVHKGAGSCLLTRPQRLEQVVRATSAVMEKALTLKVRMGYYEGRNCAHVLMPKLSEWGVSSVTIHGRTRQQRYSKVADWTYVQQCAAAAKGDLQVIGNGDVFSYTDWTEHLKSSGSKLSTCMIARGALIKPWLFREIKEGRHWDISSGERLDILKQYVHSSLTHWGSDSKGVETTRHFLLEWLGYLYRYIPVGLLEVVPQHLNWRPPSYFGRNDLETMMASESAADWIKISELLLGPAPASFVFKPKHKSNAFHRPENG